MLALLWGLAPAPGLCASEPDPFVRPPELERDIRFWIRVYTEVTTDGGLLHDDWNLGLVYEVLHFDPASTPLQREQRVREAKTRYAALLRRFAAGDTASLDRHERRILHAFGEHAGARDFLDAIDRIRFQLGQADRFHEGLIRAEAWESHIARVLEQHGVPVELAALPHVESSFNPAAYSKVGAAGLWQFMPATGRRFMRVDTLVDQRLDPYAATEAAANLMMYNYRLLGSWPLAVTAYNHGPAGLKRAEDELGTSDIAVIVKRYQGATFGFASRNFYVAFLAALEVDRNAERYFGPLTRLPDTQSTVVAVPDYVPVAALARAFKVDLQALRVLNPALRPPIWSGARWVPRGYGLRLPGAPSAQEIDAAWTRLPATQRYLAQRNDGRHRMRRGETLASLAAASGMSVARLASANGWNGSHTLARGEMLSIPLPPSRAETTPAEATEAALGQASPPATEPTAAAPLESAPAAPAPTVAAVAETAAASALPSSREPVSRGQTGTVSLLPVSSPTGNPDATDYSMRADGTILVQPEETLGHLAQWSGLEVETLKRLNRLQHHPSITLGMRLRLDLAPDAAERFLSARRSYHRALQDEFFAAHRIAGTDSYPVKRGESLWTIAEKRSLPLWLIAQYNPDARLADLRPGTTLALPRIEPINRE